VSRATRLFPCAVALAAACVAAPASAQITFYQDDNFSGTSVTTDRAVEDLRRFGFNDRASSAIVQSQLWEVCDGAGYTARCVVLRPGRYPSFSAMALNDRVSSVRPTQPDLQIAPDRLAPNASTPQVIFYEREGFAGRSFSSYAGVEDFVRFGFNDRASSVVVLGERWEACVDSNFRGRCIVLRPGRYSSLAAMGMNDRISSVRLVERQAQVEDRNYGPPPATVYDNRRRNQEALYDAPVTGVHAVMQGAQQRCWVERQEVQGSSNAGAGGAIAGALIGGILGHQIGGGFGKDLATAGGAVAGAVVGSNIAKNNAGQQTRSEDVQRCRSVPGSTQPEYWDVSYTFRGREHQVQMTSAPGDSIVVNGQGEPRTP